MVIEIREVSQQDKAQWLQLWEGYTRFYGSPQPSDVTEYTRSGCLIPLLPCWVGLPRRMATSLDLRFVSFTKARVKTPVCYLEDLFVALPMRGKGIAVALMQALQAEGKEKGWSRLYWHTRTDNPARRLYDEFTPADDYVRYRVTL